MVFTTIIKHYKEHAPKIIIIIMAWNMSVGYCFFFSFKNDSFTHHFSITPETQHSISNAKSQKESTGSRASPGYNIHQTMLLYNFLYNLEKEN